MTDLPDSFLTSRDFARIARAIAFIDAHARERPDLAAIAGHAGLSPFHFERLFRRWAGLTPKQYLQRLTGEAAEAALASEPSVLEAAHAAGLSGPGRLHDLMVRLHALTPAQVRAGGAGVKGWQGVTDTPFGTALMAGTALGLCHLAFIDAADGADAIDAADGRAGAGQGMDVAHDALRARWPAARFETDDGRARTLALQLWGGIGTRPRDLLLQTQGTNFQFRVWEALLGLPEGATVSYTDVAQRIGRPDAVRAVAGAVASNDIGWLIPCHRVLRRGGSLGGYRWGLPRKRAMLVWEHVNRVTP